MSPRSNSSCALISPFLSRSRNTSLIECVAMTVPSLSRITLDLNYRSSTDAINEISSLI